MHSVQLNVVPRQPGSKQDIRRLRREGMVLANIYGPGVKTEACAFSEKELRAAFKNDLASAAIIEIQSAAAQLKGKKVILKTISRDPMWKVDHIDLYEISMNRPLTVRVPLHIVGIADGVKNDGGILQVIRRNVLIQALPTQLPYFVEVDVSAMKLNESLHLRDVKMPANVKVMDSLDFTVVAVSEPEKEEVAAAPVAAAAGEGTATATGTGAAAAPAAGAAAAGAAPAAGGKAPAAGAKKEPEKK